MSQSILFVIVSQFTAQIAGIATQVLISYFQLYHHYH